MTRGKDKWLYSVAHMEYLDLRVASIDDAITNVAYGISGCAGHTAIYLSHAHQASEKKNVHIQPYSAHAAARDQKRIVGQTILPITQGESPTLYLALQKLLLVNGDRIWLTVGGTHSDSFRSYCPSGGKRKQTGGK